MIPLRDSTHSETYPFVTKTIIWLNVAVFLWELSLGRQLPQAPTPLCNRFRMPPSFSPPTALAQLCENAQRQIIRSAPAVALFLLVVPKSPK